MHSSSDDCGSVREHGRQIPFSASIGQKNRLAMLARPRLSLLALLVGASFSGTALADISDTLHPFLQTTISYDDNLLRLTELPGQTEGLGDTSRSVQGGVLFERPLSRQLFTGHVKFSRVSFNRYTRLDYNGKDVLGDWAWQLGNHVQGHLGTSYVETLAPFADTNSSQRNLRTQKRHYADASWLFHPNWQVRSSFVRFISDYELSEQKVNNRTEDAVELGLDYLANSGSKVGLQVRRLKSNYEFPASANVLFANNDYVQDELMANVVWQASGISKLSFVGGWVRRSHPDDSAARDNTGVNGRLIGDWDATGKLRLNGAVWREFQAVEGGLVGSSLNKGASVSALWTATGKVGMRAQLRHEKRDFSTINGLPALAGLSDASTTGSLGVTYTPVRKILLSVDGFREKRSGNSLVGSNSYRAKGVSFNASVQF